MQDFEKILADGDLRSTGNSNLIATKVKNKSDFDQLFQCLYHSNRLVVMRAADAIEKITIKDPEFLHDHKKELLHLFEKATNKELKWHLGILIPRLALTNHEFKNVWDGLVGWAKDKNNSRLVRVSAVQGLYELTKKKGDLMNNFNELSREVEKENIPSVNARIRNIRKEIEH